MARSRSGTRGRRGPRKPQRRDNQFASQVQTIDPRERGAIELPATITVKVTAKKSGYGTDSKTSAAKSVYLEFSKPPTSFIIGTAKAGNTLTAVTGPWTPAATSFTYQWYRNGAKISGATKYTYKVKSADKGKKLTVKITGHKPGYYPLGKLSAAKTVAK